MSPVCETYVGGVGGDALERVEAVLMAVEAISEARADAGRDVPGIVLVVEEWYRVRQAAARRDPALAKRLDGLMGELLATSRSRNVHVIALVQRGTAEYLLDDDAWTALCRRAADLRGAQPAVEQPSPYARPLTAEPAPVTDPLVTAVVALLADGDPCGMTATAVHAALPEHLAPSTPVALGRALSRHPALTRGHVGATPVWRLAHPSVASLGASSVIPRRSLGAPPTEGLTCDDGLPTFRKPAPVETPSESSVVAP